MATSTARALPIPPRATLIGADWTALAGLGLCAGLPLGLFGLANLLAESLGHAPLFFSPFGLPGWAGAIFHLGLLPLLGAAGWIVGQTRQGRKAQTWLAILAAALIIFPFLVAPLPSLALSLISMTLLVLAFGTAIRVAAISRKAAWLLAPVLFWLAVSAVLGLALTAAWSPPFGLIQANQPAPGA